MDGCSCHLNLGTSQLKLRRSVNQGLSPTLFNCTFQT